LITSYNLLVYIEKKYVSLIMTKFLLPIAINVIDKAVDKIPEDLEDKLKEFVIGLLKKAAAKSGNKVDDQLVEALEKALLNK
tara:strand:+ start:797 stop:1042 length:246 start_codon:yes stop_codon:yes gene_type:complete